MIYLFIYFNSVFILLFFIYIYFKRNVSSIMVTNLAILL